MNRCEDFPCCGHYDRDGAFCPNERGEFPPVVMYVGDDDYGMDWYGDDY